MLTRLRQPAVLQVVDLTVVAPSLQLMQKIFIWNCIALVSRICSTQLKRIATMRH